MPPLTIPEPKRSFPPLFRLTGLLLFLPLAISLGMIGRFSGLFTYDPSAVPMISICSLSYIGVSFFLAFRPRVLIDNHENLALLALSIAYIFCLCIFLISRVPYSTGFLSIFFSTTLFWCWLLERFLYQKIKNQVFGIVATNPLSDLADIGISCRLITDPTSLQSSNFDALVVSHDLFLDSKWSPLITSYKLQAKPILSVSDLYELFFGRVSIEHVGRDLLRVRPPQFVFHFFKRLTDVLISLFCALLLSLPFCLFAVLTLLTSPGSIIIKQARVGKDGKVFNLYKLRTMFIDAEIDGPQFSSLNDPRVTRIGKFLRRWRIDEWPQFINVLRGDMSISGPRPERPEWVAEYAKSIPYYQIRHTVRPGITGWGQVAQGYTNTTSGTKTKLEYDLYYIKNMGILLDLKIVLRTLTFLVLGERNG
jgi:UDP-GalNAc:undecaprenyl-phosphate GalNAc-1-phosphate transferase